MRPLHPICLLFISLLSVAGLRAQTVLPVSNGQHARYDAMIQMADGYISGVCVLLREDGVVKGCLFNEFGITALDFTYHPDKHKVKLHHVVPMLDKWYIRRVLRNDLVRFMEALHRGETVYQNTSRHITYQMTPITHEITE